MCDSSDRHVCSPPPRAFEKEESHAPFVRMRIGVCTDEEKFWEVVLSLPLCFVFGIHEMRVLYKMKLYRPFVGVFHRCVHYSMASLMPQLCGVKDIS